MRLHIKGGHLIDPAHQRNTQQDIWIAEGKIASVGHKPANFSADKTIDASGLIVIPGLIDLSVRLGALGNASSINTEIQAAIQGGVTSLLCLPDTEPGLDEPGLVTVLKHRARSLNQAHVYPLGALTVALKGTVLTEMLALTEAGCIGFAQADQAIADTRVLLAALRYAASFGYTVYLHPHDAYLGCNGVVHAGSCATRLGLSGVPVIAETIALHTILELVRTTHTRVHLCRLSSAAGLELVRAAKREGLPITCDVSVHHIHLTDTNMEFFDTAMHVYPPFRTLQDRDAIQAALLDGTIDAICSDHTLVHHDAKYLPFEQAAPGVTGLELLLALTLKWAYNLCQMRNEMIDADVLNTAVAKLTINAARIAGLAAGQLGVGSPADICVFDPSVHWTVGSQTLVSRGKHTPFLGEQLRGQVKMTIVDGCIVFERSPAPHSQ